MYSNLDSSLQQHMQSRLRMYSNLDSSLQLRSEGVHLSLRLLLALHAAARHLLHAVQHLCGAVQLCLHRQQLSLGYCLGLHLVQSKTTG